MLDVVLELSSNKSRSSISNCTLSEFQLLQLINFVTKLKRNIYTQIRLSKVSLERELSSVKAIWQTSAPALLRDFSPGLLLNSANRPHSSFEILPPKSNNGLRTSLKRTIDDYHQKKKT
ncbi:hypothetical protein CDAR_46841 [Caerostris darwini]|uniref:Uncharacterized protein n=1 Tax=Caerostris darwini TaxID=1538125 RepID=A0AAV4T3U9_9ARAC|nr:hypothetical protein CDAR_46841 [Caerostris darwini]